MGDTLQPLPSFQADTDRNYPCSIRLHPLEPEEELTQVVTQQHIKDMQRDMTVRKLKKAKKGFFNFLRSFDQFGQPISLNYKGDQSFKTLGGSCLTIVLFLLVLNGVLKGLENLFSNREWTERTNLEILDRRELEEGISFSDFGQFKAGFEVKPRVTSNIQSREQYLELASLIAELFFVNEIGYVQNSSGVFIQEDKTHTSAYGFDFEQLKKLKVGFKHRFKSNATAMLNSQGYLEFSIDLNGTTISGSESTTLDVQNKYVSFAHELDVNTFHKKVIEECRANETCRAILKSDSQIFNLLSEMNYCNASRNQSQKEAYVEFLREAFSDEDQKYVFLSEFYSTLETVKFSTQHGLSSCEQLGRQIKAAISADCSLSSEVVGSKCLFEHHSNNLTARLRNAQAQLQIKPVVYDSVKHIKDGANESPFQERKSKLSTPITKQFLTPNASLVENYIVTLQKSRICMDDELSAEISFNHKTKGKCQRDDFDFEALTQTGNSLSYWILKGDVNSILTLTMDSQTELTVVRYFKVFDLLALNGGYLYALLLLFSLAGKPLSAIEFKFQVAEESYYTRDKAEDLKAKYKAQADIVRIDKSFDYQKIKELFPKIRFSSAFYAISACCKCLICKQCKGLREQKRILKRANLKFQEELDVIKLLKKVRLSTDIWTQLLSKDQKKALKFSRGNVIVQNDKKKNLIVQRDEEVFEKVDDPHTSSASISFAISHSSSMTSEFRDEYFSEPDAKIEEAHTFFQLPVVNMLPLPKHRRLPPAIARKKKREKYLSENSANSSALRSRLSKFEPVSPIATQAKKGIADDVLSSSSEQARNDIKISNLNMTLGNPQFQSMKLSKTHSDKNALRSRQQSKHALDIANQPTTFELNQERSKKHRSRHRHNHRHKKRSSQLQEEGPELTKDPDYPERRLLSKKVREEAELSQVTPQDSKALLQPFGQDAPTPLASERVPSRSSAELRMRKLRKRRKKRGSSKSDPPDTTRDIGQAPFNSETINAGDD